MSRVVTASRCRFGLGVSEGSVASEGEAMSQQSMRKAARLAASDTHHRERKGAESVSRAVPIEIQDHHAVEGAEPRGYWSLSACPQVPASDCEIPFLQDDSNVRRPSRGRVRCSKRWQASSGRGTDLETRWKVN